MLVQAGKTQELLVAVDKALDRRLVEGFAIAFRELRKDLDAAVKAGVEVDAALYRTIVDTLLATKTETGASLYPYGNWCMRPVTCIGDGYCRKNPNCGD